jgi:hypothetical protein
MFGRATVVRRAWRIMGVHRKSKRLWFLVKLFDMQGETLGICHGLINLDC